MTPSMPSIATLLGPEVHARTRYYKPDPKPIPDVRDKTPGSTAVTFVIAPDQCTPLHVNENPKTIISMAQPDYGATLDVIILDAEGCIQTFPLAAGERITVKADEPHAVRGSGVNGLAVMVLKPLQPGKTDVTWEEGHEELCKNKHLAQ